MRARAARPRGAGGRPRVDPTARRTSCARTTDGPARRPALRRSRERRCQAVALKRRVRAPSLAKRLRADDGPPTGPPAPDARLHGPRSPHLVRRRRRSAPRRPATRVSQYRRRRVPPRSRSSSSAHGVPCCGARRRTWGRPTTFSGIRTAGAAPDALFTAGRRPSQPEGTEDSSMTWAGCRPAVWWRCAIEPRARVLDAGARAAARGPAPSVAPGARDAGQIGRASAPGARFGDVGPPRRRRRCLAPRPGSRPRSPRCWAHVFMADPDGVDLRFRVWSSSATRRRSAADPLIRLLGHGDRDRLLVAEARARGSGLTAAYDPPADLAPPAARGLPLAVPRSSIGCCSRRGRAAGRCRSDPAPERPGEPSGTSRVPSNPSGACNEGTGVVMLSQ